MARVFVDVNIFQDVLSAREGHDASLLVIDLVRQGKLKGYLSALTIATLWYLNRRVSQPREKIRTLVRGFGIVDLTESMVKRVLARSQFGDLEDELQLLGCQRAKSHYLVTRNVRDFQKSQKISVVTPEELLKGLSRLSR